MLLTLIILLIIYASIIWLIYRIGRVYGFLCRINDLCLSWSKDHIASIAAGNETDAYQWFASKTPSYFRLIFSFKPLKLDHWFDVKLLEKLLS